MEGLVGLLGLLGASLTVVAPAIAKLFRAWIGHRRQQVYVTRTSPDRDSVEVYAETPEDESTRSVLEDAIRKLDREAAEAPKPPGGPPPPGGKRLFDITAVDLLYGFAMLVGIFAKEVWDYINENDKFGLKLTNVLLALIVSPIVYIAVYANLPKVRDQVTLLGLAISFQNGFFWQSVFATAQAQQESSTATTSTTTIP